MNGCAPAAIRAPGEFRQARANQKWWIAVRSNPASNRMQGCQQRKRIQALLTRTANVSVGIASLVHDEVSVHAQHDSQFVIRRP